MIICGFSVAIDEQKTEEDENFWNLGKLKRWRKKEREKGRKEEKKKRREGNIIKHKLNNGK